MAIGNTATLLSGGTAAVNLQIAADAQYLRSIYDWLTRKVLEYQTTFGQTQAAANTALEAAPYSFAAGDATAITNLIVDFANLANAIQGSAITPGRDMRADAALAMGIQ